MARWACLLASDCAAISTLLMSPASLPIAQVHVELPGHTATSPRRHYGFRSYREAHGSLHIASHGLPGGIHVEFQHMGREARVWLEIDGKVSSRVGHADGHGQHILCPLLLRSTDDSPPVLCSASCTRSTLQSLAPLLI